MKKQKKRKKSNKRKQQMKDPFFNNMPQISTLKKEMSDFRSIKNIIPLLRLAGKDTSAIEEAYKKATVMENKLDNFINTATKFNKYFLNLGWCMYDTLNSDLCENAVNLADEGKIEEADTLLVNHYGEETIKFGLTLLRGTKEFRSRIELAELAKDDYFLEKYYSCIPIIYMLADGLVCDLVQKSLFAEGVELKAWDCFAGHSEGLGRLIQILAKTRRKTTTEKLTIPYRNGIMHGRDLGYANKIVAAKCWALLFAVNDLARAIRAGKKGDAPPPPPEPTFLETMEGLADSAKQLEDIRHDKKLTEDWRPRTPEELKQTLSQKQSEFSPESPEHCLVGFLNLWIKKNYGKMAALIGSIGQKKESIGKKAGWLRELIGGRELISFYLVKIEDEAAAISNIVANLAFSVDQHQHCEVDFRMLYLNRENDPEARNSRKGEWKILEHSIYRIPIF